MVVLLTASLPRNLSSILSLLHVHHPLLHGIGSLHVTVVNSIGSEYFAANIPILFSKQPLLTAAFPGQRSEQLIARSEAAEE